MEKTQRLLLARKRIKNILRDRLIANEKQLETKISEAGPLNQRCDPHVVNLALKELQSEDVVIQRKDTTGAKFFVLADVFDQSLIPHQERENQILRLYALYRKLSSKQSICGDILEDLIWDAVEKTKCYAPIGSRAHPVLHFGSFELPGQLDLIAIFTKGSPFTVLGEAKNIREWIYPSSKELWELIYKAVVYAENTGQLVVPVFVTRKIQYSTRLFFRTIGILGAQMHNQYFHPDVEDKLLEIKSKDGFGFHNITTDTTTPAWLIKWFTKTVPEQATVVNQRFVDALPILKQFAERMAQDIRGDRRAQYWNEIASKLGIRADYDFEDP